MRSRDESIATATKIMLGFADRTGLSFDKPAVRYLWTDAFAVCNLLGLARASGDRRLLELARSLIEQVHWVLGRNRAGAPGARWLSGLSDAAGAEHPTWGGLRIGKKLPERGLDEPVDDGLEWDRDGQYFHYLTKWMHALDQAARTLHQRRLNLWARELAVIAHRAFCYGPPGRRRMFWKMSIDLTRPLVPSMGQHDPVDGLVTYAELGATAEKLKTQGAGPDLRAMADDFAAMIEPPALATSDSLGIGGLLVDACRVSQLGARSGLRASLLDDLLAVALRGLETGVAAEEARWPSYRRLAFRELGLVIGLRALEYVETDGRRAAGATTRRLVSAVEPFLPIGQEIEEFWLDPSNWRNPSWTGHRDINEVMLATSLAPEGFLALTPEW